MKIFVAGPRAIRSLDKCVKKRLDNIIKNNFTLLVGDATGVDKLTQQYMHSNQYDNVIIYASRGKARNNIGNWGIEEVAVESNVKGFDFYAAKDRKMAEDADYGFMIWNGKSKGTLNNIINLTRLNKKVSVYLIPRKSFIVVKTIEDTKKMVLDCGIDATNLFDRLTKGTYHEQKCSEAKQISMF